MKERDVERIIRDVLGTEGIKFSFLQVEPAVCGWRVTVRDVADRAFVTEVPLSRPAQMRQRIMDWVEADH